ncbi:uncharacterized protein LOC119562613 [Drosophila subpulchrella]|uniref:uncharacterized protein LOC119562613 n=1 Tax=Drosophila subpulchrella TaxID=1486046 RepID=UPI0018A1A544|nr:uncharacterized protein LOC119562613 [Drosophila subpulchrella]
MRNISALMVLASIFALNGAYQVSNGINRTDDAYSKIVPRFLWNMKRGDNQESHRNTQPIIIVQQPSWKADRDSDRHHFHQSPYNTPYYHHYPQPPSRPPPQFPGMEYLNSAGSGPTYLIINPNNMQGIYLPASNSNSSNSTSSRRSAFVPSIADLLQGLNLEDLSDGIVFQDDTEVVNAAKDETTAVPSSEVPIPPADDDHQENIISENEVEALERQTLQGPGKKHMVSILMQDKRRKRFQEFLAGIYLRNYNLNIK